MRINKNYVNNSGEFAPYVLILGDRKIINPTKEQYVQAGYFPYVDTNEHLITQEIIELKQRLSDTNDKAIEFAEGWITAEDYEPIKMERQRIRLRIAELENQL